ncbi:hypothetical protein [Paenibacillus catalpae]|uniref:hypothetical protein n=1 Tax=Paenibacillus catalpae TaxID=1045775 RepID=UPI0011134C3A|nr:hypothetical protein [Paenibacillus catalpae]
MSMAGFLYFRLYKRLDKLYKCFPGCRWIATVSLLEQSNGDMLLLPSNGERQNLPRQRRGGQNGPDAWRMLNKAGDSGNMADRMQKRQRFKSGQQLG